jgi:hypothetical protein
MSTDQYVFETERAVYQGKATKSGNSVAWQIGEWGGNYTDGARPVNVFTSVGTPALRAGAYALAHNTPYKRPDGGTSYPQAFLASQIERKMALKARDGEYEVWALPGLAVRGEGFEKWLNLSDEVMVGRKVGRRGAAYELANRVASALTKSVFINVPKPEAAETETEAAEDEIPDLGMDDSIPF